MWLIILAARQKLTEQEARASSLSKVREVLVREMKSYNHLFEIATSDEVLISSLHGASKGKRNRPAVLKILENQDKYIKLFKEWLLKGDYKPLVHKATLIKEKNYYSALFLPRTMEPTRRR